jgi:hypothetical protein
VLGGYAKVSIQQAIANGDAGYRVVVYLKAAGGGISRDEHTLSGKLSHDVLDGGTAFPTDFSLSTGQYYYLCESKPGYKAWNRSTSVEGYGSGVHGLSCQFADHRTFCRGTKDGRELEMIEFENAIIRLRAKLDHG